MKISVLSAEELKNQFGIRQTPEPWYAVIESQALGSLIRLKLGHSCDDPMVWITPGQTREEALRALRRDIEIFVAMNHPKFVLPEGWFSQGEQLILLYQPKTSGTL